MTCTWRKARLSQPRLHPAALRCPGRQIGSAADIKFINKVPCVFPFPGGCLLRCRRCSPRSWCTHRIPTLPAPSSSKLTAPGSLSRHARCHVPMKPRKTFHFQKPHTAAWREWASLPRARIGQPAPDAEPAAGAEAATCLLKRTPAQSPEERAFGGSAPRFSITGFRAERLCRWLRCADVRVCKHVEGSPRCSAHASCEGAHPFDGLLCGRL